MKIMNEHDAIMKLHSNVVIIRGDVAYDKDGNEVSYDADAVQAEIDANEYKEQRLKEYPTIGDQLDALYHAGVFPTDMANAIKAIKDKFPKE
jgi:hypothetical protein